MNILHLQTEINIACGISKTIYLLVLNSKGTFNNHLICLGGDGLMRFENAGFSPVVIGFNRHSISGTMKIFFYLLSYCKKNKIDIVHSHHRYFDFLSFLISLRLNIKTVMTVQSQVSGNKLFSYKSHKLIACSNLIKEYLINYFRIKSKKIQVIHNFVDPKEISIIYDINKVQKEVGVHENYDVIGYFGRLLNAEKGIDILIKAIEILQTEFRNLFFLIMGNGPDRFIIEELIRNKITNYRIIEAKINIYEFINICDLVVLPSRIDPFPLTALEAGLIKKCVVGANRTGMIEIIKHEKNGLLFENGDAPSLANNLKRVIKDPLLRRKLGENLYQDVIKNFSVDSMLPEYYSVYQSLKVI